MTTYLLETFVILAAMGLLAVAVVAGGRRLGVGRSRGPVELAGYLPLDGRRAVYLVRIGEQVLVVGASEAGLTRLGETEVAKLPAQASQPVAPFTAVLRRLLPASGRRDASSREAP